MGPGGGRRRLEAAGWIMGLRLLRRLRRLAMTMGVLEIISNVVASSQPIFMLSVTFGFWPRGRGG